MPYDLDKMLVIGVASSAVFNLDKSDAVFKKRRKKIPSISSKKLKKSSPKRDRFPVY